MLNGRDMIIACPACTTRYVVPDSAIGVDGRTVRCAKCRHSWFQQGALPNQADRPQVDKPVPPPAAPPPAAPARSPAPAPAPPPPVVPEPQVAVDVPDTGSDSDTDADAGADSAPEPLPASEAAGLAEPPPPPAFVAEAPPPTTQWNEQSDERAWDDGSDSYSSFAHEPPFRSRINTLKLWTWAASLFAAVALAAIGAVAWYGLPDWMPLARQTFAEAQPDLVLDFPANRQDRRTLPNGTEFFGASGTVTNVGRSRRSVPTILIVLRDGRERIVYSWEVAPAKRQLAPGESVSINEAVTDVPKSAKIAEIGWKPG